MLVEAKQTAKKCWSTKRRRGDRGGSPDGGANKFNTLAVSSPRCLTQSNLDSRIATYHHAQSVQEIPTTKGSSSSQYSHTETRSQRLRSCQIEEPPLP